MTSIQQPSQVWLVDLVYLVHLVSFVQPNKQDRPNKPNNGLLTLADFFSILLRLVLDWLTGGNNLAFIFHRRRRQEGAKK